MILRALNPLILLILTAIGVAIQTSIFTSAWSLHFLEPDVILVVVIWCALNRGFVEGGILTLILGEIAEIHSAAVAGIFMVTYMLIYLMLRGASRLFVIPDLYSVVIVTLGATIFQKTASMILLQLLGASPLLWKHTLLLLLPNAAVEGFLGYWLYRWLERFDLATFKSQQAERRFEEDYLADMNSKEPVI
jgi:rod shape-determining protein MreD